jgi:hypothetical protein
MTYEKLLHRCIEDEEGCLIYQRDPSKKRPQCRVNGKAMSISRAAWTLAYGTPPDSLDVCHHCDKPRCIRLQCLWLGTRSENLQDASRKGRWPKRVEPAYTVKAKVGQHPNSKRCLVTGEVRAKLPKGSGPYIRELRQQGLTIKQLSIRLGLSQCPIRRILNGESKFYG